MKRKLISLFMSAVMLTSLSAGFTILANAQNDPIELGAYVQMGTYDINEDGTDEPIFWRCVAFEKITGTDTNGNPITDSTQTSIEYRDGYLPLMLADTSICKKAFDMSGSDKNGSHGRSEKRLLNGSNYWADSNIRDWLNSSATEGDVIYSCGNKPLYSDEAGFLNNFTAEEKAVMNTVTQKSILTDFDKDIEGSSGSETYIYKNSVTEVVQNYRKAYSEQVTDTMFLLDVQQVNNVYYNLGDYYEPYGHILYYWLRTPAANLDYLARIAFLSGEVNEYIVGSRNVGVRPAFYLNPSAVLYGEGSRYYPHTVVPTHTHYMSAEYNYENAVTFDKELTCSDGRLYIDGDIIEPRTELGSAYIDLPAGNYYLTENVSIDNCIQIKNSVNLCLNGKTFDMGESGIEVVGETGIFRLCDCGEDGTVVSDYHNGLSDTALITVRENGVFALYRGKVSNTSDKPYSYKQAVSAVDGTVKLYGGEVTAIDDNAVYFGNQAVGIALSGAPKIKGSSNKADIYLRNNGEERRLTIEAPLTSVMPYRIGAISTVPFTDGWNKKMSGKSVSDYFVSSQKGRFVDKNKDGELEIYNYAITEQPSEKNGNTVTVNGAPVLYEWYPAKVTKETVTDKNASAYEHNGRISVYDSENGWSGVFDENMNKSYFNICLSEGDIIKVKPSEPLETFSMVSLTDTVSGDFQDICNANPEGEYVFTVKENAEYTLSVVGTKSMNFPNVTANVIKTVLGSMADGQTTNKFMGSAGLYMCEITYADGTVLRSDVTEAVEYDYSIQYEDGKAVVTVPEDGTYTIIFASYDDKDTLLSVSIEEKELKKGENEPIEPKQDFDKNGTVKLMLWDTLENMIPRCGTGGN